MNIQEQTQGAVTVLKPDGPLVDRPAEEFKLRLMEALNATMGRFVVDMSAVPYVDSRGLESLLDVTEQLGEGGQALKLCGVSKTVREVLELTELVSLFEHFEDVNAAVRSFL